MKSESLILVGLSNHRSLGWMFLVDREAGSRLVLGDYWVQLKASPS